MEAVSGTHDHKPLNKVAGLAPDRAAALEPFQAGKLRFRNRIVFPGHTTNFGADTLPTGRHRAYLARRARGGAAAVITEAIRVHPTSAGRDSTLGSYHPDAVGAYGRLVAAVHDEGALAFAQIMHAGRQAAGDSARTAAWAPSPISWTFGGPVPHAMTRTDIGVVVDAFGAAATTMERAGFDGVEMHLGHGHLIQQFLSPVSNTRGDEYGGDLAGRMRLGREVLAAVHDAVPAGYPVGLRISADEFLDGGLDPEAMIEVVGLLRAEFPLAFLHVSHSAYVGRFSLSTQIADMSHGPAPYRGFPRAFRREFPDVPVIGVCRVDDVDVASDLIRTGDADLVAMARAQIADPDVVANARVGRTALTRSCLACNQACIGRIELNLPLSCVVNPTAGEEEAHASARASAVAAGAAGRSVLVVGGGPAGLEAAVTARDAGARVVLVERASVTGGQVRQARLLTGRARLARLVDELRAAAERTGVDVRTGVELRSEPGPDHRAGPAAGEVDPADFDHVVLATGARHAARVLPGPVPVLDADEAIRRRAEVAGRVVAVVDDEGGWIGAGLVETLASHGAHVHVIAGGASLFGKVTTYSRVGLMDRLAGLGVRTHLMRRPVRTAGGGLTVIDMVAGVEEAVPAVDLVVDLPPRLARDDLYEPLDRRGLAARVHVIGDALAPRSLTEATYEARTTVLRMVATDERTAHDST